MDKVEVNLDTLARKLVRYFDEKKRLNLTVTLDGHSDVTVKSNPMLAEVLLGNLVKNAFVHNVPNGMVSIKVTEHHFEIINTGSPVSDRNRVFERFNSKVLPPTVGVRLVNCKKITEVNGWKIHYDPDNQRHKFRIEF